MPNISEFKKSKNAKNPKTSKKVTPVAAAAQTSEIPETPKRRPGRTLEDGGLQPESAAKIKIVEVDPMVSEKMESGNSGDSSHSGGDHVDSTSKSTETTSRVEIRFPGSEILRSKFPRSFETAENVATEWVNDGKFEEVLPLGHPLAKAAVQQGLLKAKELEKKLMSSPVTEKVTIQAFTYAMKAQNLINQLRSKVAQKTADKKD